MPRHRAAAGMVVVLAFGLGGCGLIEQDTAEDQAVRACNLAAESTEDLSLSRQEALDRLGSAVDAAESAAAKETEYESLAEALRAQHAAASSGRDAGQIMSASGRTFDECMALDPIREQVESELDDIGR